jgi:hypothetical protein
MIPKRVIDWIAPLSHRFLEQQDMLLLTFAELAKKDIKT